MKSGCKKTTKTIYTCQGNKRTCKYWEPDSIEYEDLFRGSDCVWYMNDEDGTCANERASRKEKNVS